MNRRQISLVQASFKRIELVPELTADLFHRRLFLVAPSLQVHFDRDPEQRARAFLVLLRAVVEGLDRLDRLLPRLTSLARAYARRGITDHDYDAVGTALLWTVQQVLGDAHAHALATAWSETYDLLSGVMKQAVADLGGQPAPVSFRPSFGSFSHLVADDLRTAEPPPASGRASQPTSRLTPLYRS